jgi:hypothetical protein
MPKKTERKKTSAKRSTAKKSTAKRATSTEPKMYLPRESFAANVDGKDVSFRPDDPPIPETHPVLKKLKHLFLELG